MRLPILALAALCLTPASAFAASECRVIGDPAVLGINMIAAFTLRAGETCLFPIRIPGMMTNSGVSQKPSHGTLKQLNVTTFTYTAQRNYSGSDTFAIFGTGKGPYGSGTSVMTLNVTIR